MDKKRKELNRRNVLEKTGFAFGGLAMIGGIASAGPSDSEAVRKVEFDTKPFSNVAAGYAELFEGQVIVDLGGKLTVPSGYRGFEVEINDLQNDRGDFAPQEADVIFKPTIPKTEESDDVGTMTHSGGDIDVSESGKDYTENYEGGIKTHCDNGYLSNSEHGHTAKWYSDTWDTRAYCYKGYWDHQATKFTGLEDDSFPIVSETVSQWEYNGSEVYHYTELSMESDGEMGWWARIKTQGINNTTTLDHNFNMWSSWNQCCADGKSIWNSC